MCPFKIASRRSPLDGPESTGAMKTASVVAGRGVVGLFEIITNFSIEYYTL